MAIYSLRPFEFEAVQWLGNVLSESTEWTTAAIESMDLFRVGDEIHIYPNRPVFKIAGPNDYILNLRGYLFPMTPEDFSKFCEKV